MEFNYDTLEKGARIWLKDFCDPSLEGADLIADAIYSAHLEIKRLRHINNELILSNNKEFEQFAHNINHNLLCNEIDRLKIQRNALRLRLLSIIRNMGRSDN